MVAMNSVFNVLSRGVYLFVYADDILLVVHGKTAPRTRIRAQAATSAIARWAASVGFQLSPPKCIRCHVCSSRHRIKGPPIAINGQPVPLKKTVKILGVVIDRALTFDPHLAAMKLNIKSRVNIIKTISSHHRTNNRGIRFKVARAIIDSRLLYGLELIAPASERIEKVLAPVYNGYVRTISGLLPSTPADSACVEAGTLPFRFRLHAAIVVKAATYIAKTSGNRRVSLLEEGNRSLRKIANQGLPPVARVHWYGARSWRMTPPKIDGRIKAAFRAGDNSEALRRSVAELLRTDYSDYCHRYTDGSLSRAGVGIGVAGNIASVSLSLAPQCSVFSAEVAAIFIAATTPAEKPILILTDSHSALQAIQAEKPRHPWIQGIVKSAPSNTVYAWIPGHCGVPGNEDADNLAGAGSSGPRYKNKIPLQDLQRWVKKTTWESWSAEWSRTTVPALRKIKGDTRAWTDLPGLRDQRVISRLRTGHTRLSYNFGGTPFRKQCEICRVHSSAEHILVDCPQYERLREVHGLLHSIRDVLRDESTALAALINFLKDAKLFYDV